MTSHGALGWYIYIYIFFFFLAINSTKKTFTQDAYPICPWPGHDSKTTPGDFFCKSCPFWRLSSHQNSRQLVITTPVFFLSRCSNELRLCFFSATTWRRVMSGVFLVKCLNSFFISSKHLSGTWGGDFWVFFLGEFGGLSVGGIDATDSWGSGLGFPGTNWTQNWWDENLDTSVNPPKKQTAWQKSKLTQNKGSIRFNWMVKIFLDEISCLTLTVWRDSGICCIYILLQCSDPCQIEQKNCSHYESMKASPDFTWSVVLHIFLGISGHLPMK